MAMAKAKAKKQTSGGARLIASGRHPVLLGLTPGQREIILRAAEIDGRPVTQFLIYHSLAAGRKIIEKNV